MQGVQYRGLVQTPQHSMFHLAPDRTEFVSPARAHVPGDVCLVYRGVEAVRRLPGPVEPASGWGAAQRAADNSSISWSYEIGLMTQVAASQRVLHTATLLVACQWWAEPSLLPPSVARAQRSGIFIKGVAFQKPHGFRAFIRNKHVGVRGGNEKLVNIVPHPRQTPTCLLCLKPVQASVRVSDENKLSLPRAVREHGHHAPDRADADQRLREQATVRARRHGMQKRRDVSLGSRNRAREMSNPP